jgi:hypothetical protein
MVSVSFIDIDHLLILYFSSVYLMFGVVHACGVTHEPEHVSCLFLRWLSSICWFCIFLVCIWCLGSFVHVVFGIFCTCYGAPKDHRKVIWPLLIWASKHLLFWCFLLVCMWCVGIICICYASSLTAAYMGFQAFADLAFSSSVYVMLEDHLHMLWCTKLSWQSIWPLYIWAELFFRTRVALFGCLMLLLWPSHNNMSCPLSFRVLLVWYIITQ